MCHRKTKFIEKIWNEYPRFQIEKLRTERGFWVSEDKDKDNGGEYKGLKSESKEDEHTRGIVVL